MFRDRVDAGRRLACALEKYRGSGALVLAIPRGGAVVGDEVARHLEADFSLVVSRKLPFPADPESGFGAIAEDGSVFIHEAAAPVAGPDVARAIGREADEAVILEIPEDFHAVAQAYADWHDLSDKEVLELMRRWEKPPNVARHGGETDRGGGGGGVRERVR